MVLCEVVAEMTKVSDRQRARTLGRASFGVSLGGFILGVVAFAISLVVWFCLNVIYDTSEYSSCNYDVDGVCYNSRRYVSQCNNANYDHDSFRRCCHSYEDYYSHSYCYTK